MNYIVASLLLALGVMTQTCSEDSFVEPLFDCTDKLENPYGIVSHISRSGSQYDYDILDDAIKSLKELGVTCIRTDLDCGNITPVGEPTNTNHFDRLFSATLDNNLEVCGILTNLKYDLRCWDDYPSYWRYVDTLVSKYDKNITAYEILNEVDRYKDNDLTHKYNTLLSETYNRIKNYNPDALVIYSGISWSRAGLFKSSMKAKAHDYFDIMNFHVYDTPENLISHFEEIKKNMVEYAWSKHVWITEMGYSTCEDDPEKNIFNASEADQAIRLPKNFLISFACGVDKVFWYNHRSSEIAKNKKEYHFGLTHADFTPKPAFHTYKALIKMCPSGSSRPILSIDNGVYIVRWTSPENKQHGALWLDDTSNIPELSYLNVRYYDMVGNRISYREAIQRLNLKELVYVVSK